MMYLWWGIGFGLGLGSFTFLAQWYMKFRFSRIMRVYLGNPDKNYSLDDLREAQRKFWVWPISKVLR